MEKKIPRSQEARHTPRIQKTATEIKAVRFHIPNKPSPLKKSVSLISFNLKYKNLTPEQCVVKYKKHPHILYKRCCIICGMRRPHAKLKSKRPKQIVRKCTSNICTQTTPPTPPPERSNMETQTKKPETVVIASSQRCTQTDQISHGSWRSLFTCGMWLSIIFVLLCIIIPIVLKRVDLLNQFLNKNLRQPRTTMEKIIFYFSRSGQFKQNAGLSLAHAVVPSLGQIVFCLCVFLVLTLKAENML